MLYLASQSPRRRALLEQIGITCHQVKVEIDETPIAGESPQGYVERLARAKARAGSWQVERRPTIGADTTVVVGDEMLGKPRDQADAVRMLRALADRTHQVYTGVAIAVADREVYRLSATTVHFRAIDESEAIAYWKTGEPVDKAGAYAIQGRGAVFIRWLEGSYSGVMGLPLFETAQLLDTLGGLVGRMDQ